MAHLLIIDLPGGNDIDLVRAAVERGDDFSFLTSDLGLYRRQPLAWTALSLARALIEVPSFDYAEVEARVLDLHAGQRIDALLCLLDIRLVEAARLAHRLGVLHIRPGVAALLRDKFHVREALQSHGIEQPPFALARSNAGVRAAVDRLGLPVVIKPSDGYGSQNIVVLQYPEHLDPLLSPLDDLLPCRADYGLGVRANDRLLVERCMTGPVIGCDTLSLHGQHRLLGIHEKLFYDWPSCAIRGAYFTPRHPAAGGPPAAFATPVSDAEPAAPALGPSQVEAIERYVFDLLDAVGFDVGATHTELVLTDAGPQLIEINPRLVGAKLPRLVGYTLGRSIHSDLIDIHLGCWPVPSPARHLPCVGVVRWIVADRSGVLDRVSLPRAERPGLRCVELLKRAGDAVRPPLENADRIGYVMACAPTPAEAQALAERFVQQTRVELRTHASPAPEETASPAATVVAAVAAARPGRAHDALSRLDHGPANGAAQPPVVSACSNARVASGDVP
jgi:biotin carboxylase